MISGDAQAALTSYIRRALNLREERRQITQDLGEILKEARGDGFDSARITEVCRRVERIDKHGRDDVLAAETLKEIYIETWEGAEQGEAFAKATKDAVLLALISKPAPPPAPKKISKTVEKLRADAAAARRALGE